MVVAVVVVVVVAISISISIMIKAKTGGLENIADLPQPAGGGGVLAAEPFADLRSRVAFEGQLSDQLIFGVRFPKLGEKVLDLQITLELRQAAAGAVLGLERQGMTSAAVLLSAQIADQVDRLISD